MIQKPHDLTLDPRDAHPYSQIIRRVERGTLPAGVAAFYDPATNILRVDREVYDEADDHQRRQLHACTDILYLR